jgi:Tfp pilus assembly protein FimT
MNEILRNLKENFVKYLVLAGIAAGIALPAVLSVRHKYELKQSAMDVVSALNKAQSEATSKKVNVALAIDRGSGICTAFVDDGALSYEKKHNLTLTPGRAANLKLDPNEKVLFRTRIHQIDIVKNDRQYPFPQSVAVREASGALVGGISVDGKLSFGVEFNDRGIPTNLGVETRAYKPCSGSSIAGLFAAMDIKSKTNPIDRYQVAMNPSTGRVRLLLSVNGGACYK